MEKEIKCKYCKKNKTIVVRTNRVQVFCSVLCANKNKTKTINITDKKLRELYVIKEMTMMEIGKLYNVEWKCVQRRLRKMKIKSITQRPSRVKSYLSKRIGPSKSKSVHRLNMEKKLKRKLKKTELVHHINCDIKDNRIDNLDMLNRKEHNKIHKQLTDIAGELVRQGLIKYRRGRGYYLGVGRRYCKPKLDGENG